MDYLTDMKAILHSKRANLYLIEKCRVIVKDGRVVFFNRDKEELPILEHSHSKHYVYPIRYGYFNNSSGCKDA